MGKVHPRAAVEAVCRKTKCAVLSDGRIAPFTEMFDEEGEEVADISEATSAVAEHPDGLWLVFKLDEWDCVTIH